MCSTTGSNNHYVAVCRACCATDQKQFYIVIHLRSFVLWQQWLMMQFSFLSAYGLFDWYLYFKKVMQTDTMK